MHTWGGGGSITWEEGEQSTPQLPSHSQLGGTVPRGGGGGKGGVMMGSGHLYNSKGTHSTEEGRSTTPTCQCVSTAQPFFKCTFKKKPHLQKGNRYPPSP